MSYTIISILRSNKALSREIRQSSKFPGSYLHTVLHEHETRLLQIPGDFGSIFFLFKPLQLQNVITVYFEISVHVDRCVENVAIFNWFGVIRRC